MLAASTHEGRGVVALFVRRAGALGVSLRAPSDADLGYAGFQQDQRFTVFDETCIYPRHRG
jgi:hypothetical protein